MIPNIDPKPPGKKLIKRMSARTKWMILAPVGLIIFSFGLTVLSEAAHQRRIGEPARVWGLLGVYSLALINGGLFLFGEALRFRILTDVRKEARRSMRQLHQKLVSKSPRRKSKPDKKTKSPTKTD
ncbi:hypothetical protein DYBT9275_01902 [Dyadobacter sp. CECT 9275]|uniref:Uncharacterized protein n=1 Tax=Dyadobacter helix TaxID=2822344 RepID=A0A916J9U9_9BACT|nr:hypothetical protein [Dyadobacter sp. CECT 9275]CAG4998001.1 hypothetical protein DYBT9275_01902 [Dyadobacter sp. CECT 9275]